jgi:hypothetical protein
MTDQVQDQTTEPTEAAGQPTPQFSDVSQGGDSKAKAGPSLEKQVADLSKKLAEQDAQIRGLQSGKDKSNDRRDREIESLKKHLSPDARAEIDKAVEARERTRDDIRAVVEEMQPSSAPVRGRTVKQEYLDRAAKILSDLSPEEQQTVLSQVAKQEFTSIDDAIIAVGNEKVNVKVNGIQKAQPASLAGAIPPTGGTVPQKDLKTEYIKEIKAARGNHALGMAVMKKYRDLGVDIGSVDFRL